MWSLLSVNQLLAMQLYLLHFFYFKILFIQELLCNTSNVFNSFKFKIIKIDQISQNVELSQNHRLNSQLIIITLHEQQILLVLNLLVFNNTFFQIYLSYVNIIDFYQVLVFWTLSYFPMGTQFKFWTLHLVRPISFFYTFKYCFKIRLVFHHTL